MPAVDLGARGAGRYEDHGHLLRLRLHRVANLQQITPIMKRSGINQKLLPCKSETPEKNYEAPGASPLCAYYHLEGKHSFIMRHKLVEQERFASTIRTHDGYYCLYRYDMQSKISPGTKSMSTPLTMSVFIPRRISKLSGTDDILTISVDPCN